jgi:hypothetical protein
MNHVICGAAFVDEIIAATIDKRAVVCQTE